MVKLFSLVVSCEELEKTKWLHEKQEVSQNGKVSSDMSWPASENWSNRHMVKSNNFQYLEMVKLDTYFKLSMYCDKQYQHFDQ